ncbi:hypothetical protein G4B84_005007 [Aspergillus flavus NRRL3357]|nr:uncharacterized protein G4B84_005007 [Aspergillus flavus NRRL3357]QMW29672.1 hypothetical protein G4B84_005007 [Aspergillus flavus NRRL3357]QMW41744.1 hypothetical protein G4B11_005068 [Aspergillus flavus]
MALSRTIASLCLELVNSSRVARIRGDDAPTSSTMISGVARADPWDGTGYSTVALASDSRVSADGESSDEVRTLVQNLLKGYKASILNAYPTSPSIGPSHAMSMDGVFRAQSSHSTRPVDMAFPTSPLEGDRAI